MCVFRCISPVQARRKVQWESDMFYRKRQRAISPERQAKVNSSEVEECPVCPGRLLVRFKAWDGTDRDATMEECQDRYGTLLRDRQNFELFRYRRLEEQEAMAPNEWDWSFVSN